MKTTATSARRAGSLRGPHRAAVTLVELLFVMMILGILVAISLGVLSGATVQARIERTRAVITKLDQLITEKYESYKTRAVPIKVPAGMRSVGEPFQDTASDMLLTNGFYDAGEMWTDQPDKNGVMNNQYDWGAAELRLLALRELMRMEMPNIKADVAENPLVIGSFQIITRPSLSRNYFRRANSIPGGIAAWTNQFEGAECLYLIVSAMRDGEDSAISFFAPSEIGDFDGDGMKEFLDAFGQPIEFVRWPCGYSEHPGADNEWGVASQDDGGDMIVDNPEDAGNGDDILPPPTPQTRNFRKAPDPFDPLQVDGRYRLPNKFIVPFALKPLIYSPGSDKEYHVRVSGATSGKALSNPYLVDFGSSPPNLSPGSPYDPSGRAGFADNITNHDFSEK
jgi:hypothetical protein